MDLVTVAQNLGLGLKRSTVDLHPYSPKWAKAYQLFSQTISSLSKQSIQIEHVGSTALPGSFAKPILDLLLIYEDHQFFHQELLPALLQLGFTAKGEMGIAGREFFTFYDKAQEIDHVHIHAFIRGHEHINRLIVFRDHLLSDEAVKQAYSAFKQRLKTNNTPRKSYPSAKDDFVQRILQQEASHLLHIEIADKTHLALFEPKDYENLFAAVDADRAHLTVFLPWVKETKTAADHLPFIERAWQQYLRDDGWQAKIIYDGKLIGSAGFHGIDWQERTSTIGYWLASAFCGQGIMTQTVAALIRHAFNVWQLASVTIKCEKANRASRAIALRLGFHEESTSDDKYFLYTKYRSS